MTYSTSGDNNPQHVEPTAVNTQQAEISDLELQLHMATPCYCTTCNQTVMVRQEGCIVAYIGSMLDTVACIMEVSD